VNPPNHPFAKWYGSEMMCNGSWPEALDQERRDRPVDHRHVQHLQEDEEHEHRRVERLRRVHHRLVDRDVGQRGDEATGHDDSLAPDAVRQRPENDEERGGQDQGDRNDHVRRVDRNLENRLKEDERVELAGVPDHGLPGRRAE
jgi:hypothetical protein